MNLRTTLLPAGEPRHSALVVAMPQATARRFRRDAASEAEPRGQILLFTGVRYERMPEVQVEPTVRQRKRS